MTYEIKNGIYIYINGEPAVFPRDINYIPVSVIYGLTETSKFPIPIKLDSEGRLMINAAGSTVEVGAVELENLSQGRKLNIVLSNDTANNLTGLLFFGINSENKVKPFLFDLNNKLLVSDENNNLVLNEIKNYLLNSLTNGIIERDSEGLVSSITTTNKLLNKTTKIIFNRNVNGELISWDEVLI